MLGALDFKGLEILGTQLLFLEHSLGNSSYCCIIVTLSHTLQDYHGSNWFARDVMAAMWVVRNNSLSLRWELNFTFMQILRKKNLYCIDHQHGRLVMWLKTKNKEKRNAMTA